ncbi:amidase [Labrys miyagiensis]|nr:amidase family protein [Labrys miyagiensis]
MTGSLLKTYADCDALDLASLVKRGEVSPMELVEAAITLVEHLNPQLNAVVHRLYDAGRASAAMVDRHAPFAGVPFLLKELGTAFEGAPLTNASRYLQDRVATADSQAVRRIRAAGLVTIGRSNAPEFGLSITTEPRLYGATRNPWRREATAGGSSGGAAAAVATRMVPMAEANGGAGSIRLPASCCGVVGLKPSRGRVNLSAPADLWYGGVASFCCTRTVRDTAAYLDALARGPASEPQALSWPEESWLQLSARMPRRLRIAFTVTSPNGMPVDPQVKAAVLAAAKELEGFGHSIEEHDMPLDGDAAWRIYARMVPARAAAEFRRLETVVGRRVTRDDVEPVTWAIIERGRGADSGQHARDDQELRQLGRAVADDLMPYDIFITPTLTQLPRPVGYYDMGDGDLDRYLSRWSDAVFAFPFNISGLPAISLPLGWTADEIPIGVQLAGRHGDEASVLAISTQLEHAMPWKDRRPKGGAPS